MKTRAQRRNVADTAADGDSLVRPSIRTLRRGKAVDLETVDDGTEAKTVSKNSKSLNESVTKKESYITRKRLEPSQAEDDHSYSSSDERSSESDDENYNEQKYNSSTILPPSASKGARKDYSSSKLSFSHNEEEADEARPQQRKDASFRRDYSLTKPTSSDAEDELDQSRLRLRKDEKYVNFKTSSSFYGKLKDEDLPIQDEKRHQMKYKSTSSSHGITKQYPNYSTPISAGNKLVNAKKADLLFSEDETEEQPRSSPGRSTPNYSKKKKNLHLVYIVIILLLVGALLFSVQHLNTEKLSSQKAADKLHILNSFSDGFRKLPILFPSQSQDLWQRSQRILNAHLNRGEENKGPAIILLTAAQDGKEMLYCIANQLAKAYASSRNSSYTVLSGMDKMSETSEEVKMYIDKRFSEGFQTNKAAVLHQIELLPPGSVLILYKYCDHENAAFQNVALVLTVLLNNATLRSDIQLAELEDAVYNFLKESFIGSQSGASHNEMDQDKLSGVWSRIAHVVLPVLPENHTVKECEEPKAHFKGEDEKLAPQQGDKAV